MKREGLEGQQQIRSIEKKMEGMQLGEQKKQIEESNGERRSEAREKVEFGQQEAQKAPLYFCDQSSGQWFIHPQFQQYFMMQLEIVEELKTTVNKKWTEHEASDYFRFLTDLQTYITNFIFGFQVPTFQDFVMWREAIKPYNPVGFELYEKQLNYMRKIYEFRSDNRPFKEPPQPKAQHRKEQPKSTQEVKRFQKPRYVQSTNPKKGKKHYVQKASKL